MNSIEGIRLGFETAFIDGSIVSDEAIRPQFVSNNYKEGKKVISSIEEELLSCEEFKISVAFITLSGVEPLLQVLQSLEKQGVKGQILTTDYLTFSQPKALEKLHELTNITLKMYKCPDDENGFHTKGYIFKKDNIYRIIVGSSNMTNRALTVNKEWNTKVISTEQGEVAKKILDEFNDLWNSPETLEYDEFIDGYREKYKIIEHQREIAKNEEIPSIEKYRLQPNAMQSAFVANLRRIIEEGHDRALLISATGTGKSYASAFAMRELGYKKVLFLVHRGNLARQTKRSYERVFDKSVKMGLVGSGRNEYDADYVFATVQTLNKDAHLFEYAPDHFDCIILDEAHHSPANTYQKIMKYFKPKLYLGMTATPDKRDDNIEGRNVYELFDYQIALDIRLEQAMEENLLCPFHYFGISDIYSLDDKEIKSQKLSERDFNRLTGDERVRHIVKQAHYYGYSGDRVKGLIFCSRIEETERLSEKFNSIINPDTGKPYRTIALNGSASDDERQNAFDRLAMDEEEATPDKTPLDYIFSVEILNEGVDIVEVNQVIMLRPTESPIVFIQQLGRGLRKANGKEFVVILDFIGNYNNNFMIPIALSGDRSYNKDVIRKYVISGNSTIPGASTVHFDEVSRERIFASVDKIKGMKSIIKESYKNLKYRLGRVPYLIDFYENGEVDPTVIVREYKTYQLLLEEMEGDAYKGRLSDEEYTIIEYLSKTVLSGVRPYELQVLHKILIQDTVNYRQFCNEFCNVYGYSVDTESFDNAIDVLHGKFVSKEEEYQKYKNIDLVKVDEHRMMTRMQVLADMISHQEFYKQVNDIVDVGLKRFAERNKGRIGENNCFVLYEKYSRRDISLLMNCGKDLSSTMYGMKKINDDVFIFVTYHKQEGEEGKEYADGKPDYADEFENNTIFLWDSQIGKGLDSSYMNDVRSAKHKHLLVKKSDLETSFYYMGEFDIAEERAAKKKNNKGVEQDIAKITMRMHTPVREDLLRYLQSNIISEEKMA